MSFYNELKRRNVFRVSAAYLALSWVATQVTGEIVPALNLPESIRTTVVWLSLIGFPFVVAFSWVFELTPEGLKRDSEVSRSGSITQVTDRRLDYIIIAMLAVAIGLFALQYFRPPPSDPPTQGAFAASDRAPGTTTQARDPDVSSGIATDDKSIAVLPFTDMSAEKNQEYMSDGIAEELLNLLAQVPDLKVIARTSSFAFKGQNTEIAEIASKLNVAHVLEGSVRKSGNTVRITAQLIRTADSTHLWSETYDRSLDDIFTVQDEIARAIVQALQIKLAGGELNRRKGGTQNLEAYQLYQQAMIAMYQNSRVSLETAGEYLELAIKLDPNYGLALSQLANTVGLQADNGFVDRAEGYELMRKLAQQAVQLSPDLADAHAALQYVYMAFDWNWAAAETEGRRALAIDPENSQALNVAGKLAAALGHWDDSERHYLAALVRDPLNTYVLWNLGNTYYRAGRFADAEGIFRKLLALEPGFAWTRSSIGLTLLAQGKSEEALAMAQQDVDEANRLSVLPIFLQAVGRQAEADEALKAQIDYWADTWAYVVAQTYAYRGDNDLALEWLERSYRQKDQGLIEITGEPLFKNLAHDQRYKTFLGKMNLPTD